MTRSGMRGLRAAALTGTLVLLSSVALADESAIKLGVLEDQSGDFAAATIGKVHAIQLAADEINKAGGIMGRPLELVTYDTQSENTRYQEFMRRVLQRDKVDVVFAGMLRDIENGGADIFRDGRAVGIEPQQDESPRTWRAELVRGRHRLGKQRSGPIPPR